MVDGHDGHSVFREHGLAGVQPRVVTTSRGHYVHALCLWVRVGHANGGWPAATICDGVVVLLSLVIDQAGLPRGRACLEELRAAASIALAAGTVHVMGEEEPR